TDDFVDAAFTSMIDAVIAQHAGSESAAIDLLNDEFFNCPESNPIACSHFGFHTFVFSFVDAPPHNFSGAWQTNAGEVARLRGAARSAEMNDRKSDERAKPVVPVSTTRGQVIMGLRSDPAPPPTLGDSLSEDSADTLAHELGHKLLGLRDQYEEQGHRDDVLYVNTRDLMGDETGWPHLCAFHKVIKGWIDHDDVLLLGRPPSEMPIQDLDVVLVQLERYDPEWSDEERSAVLASLPGTPGDTPVCAAVFLRLDGETEGGEAVTGRIFDTLELRAKTGEFSQTLDPPRVVMINALDYEDDTRYAEGEEPDPIEVPHIYRYRRKLHLLTDEEPQAVGDSFDFAEANEFIEVGLTVEVMEWGQANVSGGQAELARVRINWVREQSIELGFTESSPNWQSPDIGIDAPPKYRDVDVGFPIGEPLDQGEVVRVPAAGEDDIMHRVFVRVWNFGEVEACKVQIQLLKRDPGAGDVKHQFVAERIIEELPPSGDDSPHTLAFDWDVHSSQQPHFCWRAEIGDRDVPVVNNVPIANDDTTEKHNWAQQNVFEFDMPGDSPPKPLQLTYRVYNTGPLPEVAVVRPHGMPEGVTLRVNPGRAVVPAGGSRLFRLTLEVAEEYLHRVCGKDIDFRVETWRVTGESEERWGAVRYRLKPRLKTAISIEGWWVGSLISIHGGIDPDVGAGVVELHIHPAGEADFWHTVNLGPAATYTLDLDGAAFSATELVATARYDGSPDHAAAISEVLHLKTTNVG
ncbi:MAG: hypothetical protein KY395_08285, partial [Actinobacteria bacterium]|nr:hypothetical protein [Actinomycetota bacterium]